MDTAAKKKRFAVEKARFRKKRAFILQKGDPFYNPNLTLTMKSWTCRDERREARKPYLKYLHL